MPELTSNTHNISALTVVHGPRNTVLEWRAGEGATDVYARVSWGVWYLHAYPGKFLKFQSLRGLEMHQNFCKYHGLWAFRPWNWCVGKEKVPKGGVRGVGGRGTIAPLPARSLLYLSPDHVCRGERLAWHRLNPLAMIPFYYATA